MEIIGVLASASQLAFYGLSITTSITEIYRRVQDTPERIRQHTDQLRHLISTAQLIEKNKFLQTEIIDDHLITTLGQARALSKILEQIKADYTHGVVRKYLKIINGTKEKEILTQFIGLEKEKSALLLCISVIHTDLLGDIHVYVGTLIQEPSLKMSEERESRQQIAANDLSLVNSSIIRCRISPIRIVNLADIRLGFQRRANCCEQKWCSNYLQSGVIKEKAGDS